MCVLSSLKLYQSFFGAGAAGGGEASDGAIGADDSMAGNNKRERISRKCISNGPACDRFADSAGKL